MTEFCKMTEKKRGTAPRRAITPGLRASMTDPWTRDYGWGAARTAPPGASFRVSCTAASEVVTIEPRGTR